MPVVKSRTVSVGPKPDVGADVLEFERIEEDFTRIRAKKLTADTRKILDQLASRIQGLQSLLRVRFVIRDPREAGAAIVDALKNADGGSYAGV